MAYLSLNAVSFTSLSVAIVLIHLFIWMTLVAVANSLKALPNLHTFRWIGSGPSFDDTVAKGLPVNLKMLDVQS